MRWFYFPIIFRIFFYHDLNWIVLEHPTSKQDCTPIWLAPSPLPVSPWETLIVDQLWLQIWIWLVHLGLWSQWFAQGRMLMISHSHDFSPFLKWNIREPGSLPETCLWLPCALHPPSKDLSKNDRPAPSKGQMTALLLPSCRSRWYRPTLLKQEKNTQL